MTPDTVASHRTPRVAESTTNVPAGDAGPPFDELNDELSKGEQTRKSVLDSAIVRFGRDGYRSTSVADIARDAGVGGTVAYAYFSNKEALFRAAIDEDAAAVIREGLAVIQAVPADVDDWHQRLFFALLDAAERHPLARRMLAGLEPDVTERVLDIPALNDMRQVVADLLAAEQRAGTVRPDIDPAAIANGVVALLLSLLMSVVQVGTGAAGTYAADVAAVFRAAIGPISPA